MESLYYVEIKLTNLSLTVKEINLNKSIFIDSVEIIHINHIIFMLSLKEIIQLNKYNMQTFNLLKLKAVIALLSLQ